MSISRSLLRPNVLMIALVASLTLAGCGTKESADEVSAVRSRSRGRNSTYHREPILRFLTALEAQALS